MAVGLIKPFLEIYLFLETVDIGFAKKKKDGRHKTAVPKIIFLGIDSYNLMSFAIESGCNSRYSQRIVNCL